MINKVILMCRLGKDPEVRTTQGGTSVASLNVAVNRRYKRDGDPEADWFRCTAFGKTAEAMEKYLHKGSKILIDGEVQNDNYEDKHGNKVYGTRIIINSWEFAESKTAAETTSSAPNPAADEGGFMAVPDNAEDEIPFI